MVYNTRLVCLSISLLPRCCGNWTHCTAQALLPHSASAFAFAERLGVVFSSSTSASAATSPPTAASTADHAPSSTSGAAACSVSRCADEALAGASAHLRNSASVLSAAEPMQNDFGSPFFPPPPTTPPPPPPSRGVGAEYPPKKRAPHSRLPLLRLPKFARVLPSLADGVRAEFVEAERTAYDAKADDGTVVWPRVSVGVRGRATLPVGTLAVAAATLTAATDALPPAPSPATLPSSFRAERSRDAAAEGDVARPASGGVNVTAVAAFTCRVARSIALSPHAGETATSSPASHIAVGACPRIDDGDDVFTAAALARARSPIEGKR